MGLVLFVCVENTFRSVLSEALFNAAAPPGWRAESAGIQAASAINPVAVKSLMRALGMPVGALRKPLRNLEGDVLAKGVRIIQELGLDRRYGYKVPEQLARAA